MFKPHFGNCSCCGEYGFIVVKKGLRDACNHRQKQEKKSARSPVANSGRNEHKSFSGAETQDIEGYTNVSRTPIRKKVLKKRSIGKGKIREKVDFGGTSGLQGITKAHTLVYMKALGYTIADFIPCEITGLRCNDIHHIYARGMGGTAKENELYNKIENLMAVTREYHEEYGDRDQYYGFLIQKHFEFLDANGVKYDKRFFDKWPQE